MKTTIKFWLTTLAATLLSYGAWAFNDAFVLTQGGTLYDSVETNKVIVLDDTAKVTSYSEGKFDVTFKVYAPESFTSKAQCQQIKIDGMTGYGDWAQEAYGTYQGRFYLAETIELKLDDLKKANKAHASGDAEGEPTPCMLRHTFEWSENPADTITYSIVADPKTLIIKDYDGRVVWDNGNTNIHPTIQANYSGDDSRIQFNEASNVVSVAGTFATNAIPQLYTQVSTNGLPFYNWNVKVTVRHQSGIDGAFYYHTTNNDNQITFKNTFKHPDTYKNDPSSLVLTEANLGTALMHEKAFAQKFVFDFNNNGLFKDDDLLQVIYDAKNITLTNNIEVGAASTNFCGATWKELGKLDKVEVLKDEKAAVIGSYDEATRTITFTGDSLGDVKDGKWTGSFKLTAPAWVKSFGALIKYIDGNYEYVMDSEGGRPFGNFKFAISVNDLVFSEGDVTNKLVMDWNGNGYGETTYTVVFKKEGLKLFTSHDHGTQVYPVKADDYSKFGNVFKYCSAKDAKTILVDDILKFDEKIAYYIYAPTWIGTNMTSTACITTTYTNDVVASVVTNGVALVNDNGRLRVNYDERDARYFVTNYLFKGVANHRTEKGFTWEQYAEPDGQAEYTVRETYVFDTGDMSKKTYKYADGTKAWPLEYKGAKITSKLAYTGDEESEITLEDNELANETNHVGRARWFFSYDIALPSDITSNNYMRVWMRKRETGAKSWVNDWFCLSSNDFAGAVANLTNNLWTMDAESLERVIATNKVDGTVLKRTTEFIWNSWKVPAEDATPDTTLTIVLDPSENDFFYTQGTNTVEFPNPVEIKPSETKYKGIKPWISSDDTNKLAIVSTDLEDFVLSLTNTTLNAVKDSFYVAMLKIDAPAGIYGINYRDVLVNGEKAGLHIACSNNVAKMYLNAKFTLADFLAVEEDEDGFRSIVKNYTITWAEGKTSEVKVTMELKDLTLFQGGDQVYPSTVKMAYWKKGFKPEDPGSTTGIEGTYGFITKANNDVIESYTNATPAQYYTKGVNLGTTLGKDYTILRVELPAWLAATNVETLAKAKYRLYREEEEKPLTDVLNPIQGKLDYQRYVIVCQQRPKKNSELGKSFVRGDDYFTTNIVEFAWDGVNYDTLVTLAYSTMADDHAVDKIYDINTNACACIVGGVDFDKVDLYGSVKLPENPVVAVDTNFYGVKWVKHWHLRVNDDEVGPYANGEEIFGRDLCPYYVKGIDFVLAPHILSNVYYYVVNGVPTTNNFSTVCATLKAGDTLKLLPTVPRGPLTQRFINRLPSGITLDLTAFSVVTQDEIVVDKALAIKAKRFVATDDANPTGIKVLGTNANFKVEIEGVKGEKDLFVGGVLVKDGATFELEGNLDVTNRCVTVMNGSTLKVSGYVHCRALTADGFADGPAVKALNEEGFEGAKNTVTLGGEVSFSKYVSGTMVKPTAIVEVTDTILTVNGGVHKNEVINDRFAIIAGEGSELTLNGGVVAGRSAVYFAGETLTIPSSATNLYVYGTDEATALVDAGVQYTGDAIIIDNRSGTIDAANVKISGGYFLARNGGSAIAVYGEKLTNIIAGWGYYGGKSPTVADELFYADLGCKRVNCTDASLLKLGYTDMAQNTKEFELTYELNDGKSTKTLQKTYTIGSYEPLPGADSMIRKDYTFAGWFFNPEFTGKKAESFVDVVDELRETRAAVTVYAKWEAITYTATLDVVGIKYVGGVATQGICKVGTVITYGDYVTTYEGNPTNKFEEKFGQAQQIELATPECKGYTFIAWIDEEGTKYDTLPQGTTDCSDHQLTAVWSLDTYTVTYGQYDYPSQPEPVKFTVETPQWLSGENLDMRPGYTWVNIGGFWPHCNWYAAGTTNLVRNTSTFNSDTNVVGVWRNQNTGAYVDGNTRAIVGEGAVFGPAKTTKYYGFVLGNPDYTNVVWDMVGTVEFTVSRSKDRYFIRSTETVLGKAKTTSGNYVGGGADVTFTPDNLKQSLHISNTGIEGDTVFAVPALTTTEKANYTLKIDGDDTAPALLRIAVNAKGKASVNATLADGTKFAVSAQAIAAQGGASYMLPIVWQKKYAGNNLGGFAALVSISNDVAQLISEDYARYDSYNKSGALTTTRYDNWYSDGAAVDGLKLTNGTYQINYANRSIEAIVTNKTGNLVIYTPQVTKKIKAGKSYTTTKLIKNTVTRNVKTGVLSGTVKVQVNGANGKLVSFKVNGIMSSDKRRGYAYATASAWTDTDKKKYGPETVFVTISRRK